jgi:hypothetical protein
MLCKCQEIHPDDVGKPGCSIYNITEALEVRWRRK